MSHNLSVNIGDYANGNAWAGSVNGDADALASRGAGAAMNELSKAMSAGHILGSAQGNANQTNMGALKTESLERNLKIIEFKESEIKFWKRIPKTAAYSTTEEYNQLTSYGQNVGGFVGEGELPEEEDSQYTRKSQQVKYLGTTRSVTHQSTLVNISTGSLIQRENKNGIMWILRAANRALFHGDAYTVSHEWNGVYSQHMANDEFNTMSEYFNSELVLDLDGKALNQADIERACRVILVRHGHANLLMAPPRVLSDFSTRFYANQRTNIGQPGAVDNATVGQYISKFRSQFGIIDFEYDIFAAKNPGKLPTSGTVPPKAPATPTAGVAPAPVVDGEKNFAGHAGDYFYGVAAVNRYGESAMVQLGAGLITVAANQAVDLTFTATAGPYAPTAYRIYRSKANPTTTFATTIMYPLFLSAATGTGKQGSLASGVDGAVALKVRDRNRYLPDTEQAFLLQADTDVYEFRQLAPLMKMPLARLSPAERWMVLLYGTPVIYQPSKMVVFNNIGTSIV